MTDAILYAARDFVRNNDFGGFTYDKASSEIMPDGHPQPRMGNVFAAIHQKGMTSDSMNCLNEYYDWSVTLTMRLQGIPLDRIGDQLLARQVADQTGFNRRVIGLRSLLHMNWQILAAANEYLLTMVPENVAFAYGFSEPARFGSAELPVLVGGEWFTGDSANESVGLKTEIAMVNCRRGPIPIGSYS